MSITQNTEEFLNSSVASQGVTYFPKWSHDFTCKEIKEVWCDLEAPLRKPRNRKVTINDLKQLTDDELHKLGFLHFNDKLITIPLWTYNYIHDGEELVCIDMSKAIKGITDIDLDVRRGCIAYGFVR